MSDWSAWWSTAYTEAYPVRGMLARCVETWEDKERSLTKIEQARVIAFLKNSHVTPRSLAGYGELTQDEFEQVLNRYAPTREIVIYRILDYIERNQCRLINRLGRTQALKRGTSSMTARRE